MARVKRGVIARARHKKILKQAKGYYGARSRVYRSGRKSESSSGLISQWKRERCSLFSFIPVMSRIACA